MQLRSALLAASILALPAAALAQPVVGPYVSLGAGVDLFQDQSVKNASLPALGLSSQTFGHISYDADYAVNGAVGWGLGNGLRLEATGDYLHGDINKSPHLPGVLRLGSRRPDVHALARSSPKPRRPARMCRPRRSK
jgi:OOP family OmpA-OmpF porin